MGRRGALHALIGGPALGQPAESASRKKGFPTRKWGSRYRASAKKRRLIELADHLRIGVLPLYSAPAWAYTGAKETFFGLFRGFPFVRLPVFILAFYIFPL